MALSRRSLLCTLTGAMAIAAAAGCDDGTTAVTAPTPALSAGEAGFFGGTDLAWVEINIAMNEQLQPLLALAPAQASRAAVKAFAAQVQAFTERELATLRQLHDQAKLPAENPHEGMPMPGMVTPSQVSAAKAAAGRAFDKLLLQDVKAHLEQGTSLATSEEKAGVEPQTRALASQVLSARATALKQLTGLTAG